MGIFDALACWIRWLAGAIKTVVVEGFELVLDVIIGTINLFLTLLPKDPGASAEMIDSQIIMAFNYVVPMGLIMAEFGFLMGAWIAYRIYQWLLAWGKVDY